MININIGVIGYGYWGPNLVRNFFAMPECTVVKVADSRADRLKLLHKNYPSILGVTAINDIFNDTSIDAVIIATPVNTHYAFAKKALENGQNVLIEKPLTSSVEDADRLIELAESKRLTLMTDHTFLYTGAVEKMKDLITRQEIGEPQYFDSTRINLGLFQPDVNVLWDLAPHDLSILLYLIDKIPCSINATGISHTRNHIENIAFLTINYHSNFIAHFNCSWTSPVKVRSTLIGGDKKMIVYNDLEPSEKIRVYDTGFKHESDDIKNQIMVDYRTGDIFIPKISSREALANVAEDFIRSIIMKREPLANAQLGRKVVQILEASQESIKRKGKEIKISK